MGFEFFQKLFFRRNRKKITIFSGRYAASWPTLQATILSSGPGSPWQSRNSKEIQKIHFKIKCIFFLKKSELFSKNVQEPVLYIQNLQWGSNFFRNCFFDETEQISEFFSGWYAASWPMLQAAIPSPGLTRRAFAITDSMKHTGKTCIRA